MLLACFRVVLALALLTPTAYPAEPPSNANRLTYLDEPENPFYPHLQFPKLTTPQWVGETNVEAVVVLAIDDMAETKKYETFLRPILDRLKKIDGRAPLSIMTCRVDPQDQQLQSWLKEGLSIEVHTLKHPCPLLANNDFDSARQTVNDCIDLLNQIPNTSPVAFRMPCCDSINSLSPRFFAEILNSQTAQKHFLQIDSSVFNITTTNDPVLPREWVFDADGKEKFRKYLPFPAFSTTIDDYPYPYIIGNACWEFPCAVPSDWEAQNLHKSNNPETVEDWKTMLDVVVRKQGVFNLVFHPHGWIRNDQIVELIDYAVTKYGNKIKFLSFREAAERLTKNLFLEQPLRAADGSENGVRLLDLNNDGYLDVIIGNQALKRTRIWDALNRTWKDSTFPALVTHSKHRSDISFGVLGTNGLASMLVHAPSQARAWKFDGLGWVEDENLVKGIEINGGAAFSASHTNAIDVRFRDIDQNGVCELILRGKNVNALFEWNTARNSWELLPFSLPDQALFSESSGNDAGLRFVDLNGDGFDDIIFSDEKQFGVYLFNNQPFVGLPRGWSTVVKFGTRGGKADSLSAGQDGDSPVPMISRGEAHPNNGAWFRNGFLWIQNESTAKLPDIVDRRSFKALVSLDAPAPKSPQESLACWKARPGFKVELVASEPMIESPVAFEWSADGKLWVVEMIDYPEGVGGKPAGRVRFLEGTHNDGRYDRSTVFLDGLSFPNGIYPWRKGVLISDPPDIIYAEDTDGDGKADVKKVLYTGFNPGNPQHRANGYDYGLDNWLYGANGDSGGEVTSVLTGRKEGIDGRDFRFRPDTGEFEAESGMTQFGRHRDDWGNWFGNDNPEWLWHFVFSERYLARNPHLPVKENKRYLANYPDSKRVFAISKPMERFNDPNGAEHVTSGNSPTPYRDDLFGSDFAISVFASEPVHNVVHREVLEPDGLTFKSHRAGGEETNEFLASTDNWTRPTMTKTGPDGALYVADMYRLVIEHPEWIPAERQKVIDMRAGADKGRIYRVYPENAALRKVPRLDHLSPIELVDALESPNGWQRDTAQRLLVQAQSKDAIASLERLARESHRAKTRVQALCTLDGLGALKTQTLEIAFRDPDAHVREHGIRLSEPFLNSVAADVRRRIPASFQTALLNLAEDPNIRVRAQLAFTLGEWNDSRAGAALAGIALKDWSVPFMPTAVMSSATGHVGSMLSFCFEQQVPPPGLIEKLISLAGAMGDDASVASSLEKTSRPRAGSFEHWQFSIITAFLDELDRQNKSLRDFHESASETLRKAIDALQPMFVRARALAQESISNNAPDLPAGWIGLLGRGISGRETDLGLLAEFLKPQAPPDVQHAAVNSLRHLRGVDIAPVLISAWKGYSPSVRADVLSTLLANQEWTSVLLAGIESREIPLAHIAPEYRQRLLGHSDETIRNRAEKIFAVNSDRQTILRQYESVATLTGNAQKGHGVFIQNCATCHRVKAEGNAVGPDLAMMSDKPASVFVTAIFDPNQAVETRYIAYNVLTQSDRELSGVISTETANSITVKNAGGSEETILRRDIKELKSSGLSLMPEGFETILKPQDAADLIAYLKSQKR